MPFSYPKSLVAGTPENVNDLNTNLTGAAADWEHAFGTYKEVTSVAGIATNAVAGTVLFLVNGSWGNPTNGFGPTNPPALFWYDPADVTAGSRSNKLHIRALGAANGTAPAMNFTVGLYPVTGIGGGTNVVTMTLGGAVTGSTAALNALAANASLAATSGDFAYPASAGGYALGMAISGTQAANSAVFISAVLSNRQV